MSRPLTLRVLDQELAVVRLPVDTAVPSWLPATGFTSVTRTAHELSIVCEAGAVPQASEASDADVRDGGVDRSVEAGWAVLELEGPFEFTLTGILASVLVPLADAGIGIFALSTFDTDYVLVKADHLDATVETLRSAGHQVHRARSGAVEGDRS